MHFSKLKKEWNKYKKNDLCLPYRLLDFIWRKRYKQSLIFVWVIGCLFIFIIESIAKDINNITAGEKILGLIYYSTAVVIFWYTRETYDLKVIQQKELKEVRKQTDFQKRPF